MVALSSDCSCNAFSTLFWLFTQAFREYDRGGIPFTAYTQEESIQAQQGVPLLHTHTHTPVIMKKRKIVLWSHLS